MKKSSSLLSFPLVVLFAVACGEAAAGGAPGAAGQKDGLDGIKAVFQTLADASAAGDVQKGKALTLSLVPDEAALAKVLRDDVAADVRAKIMATFRNLPASDEALARVLVPGNGRTEIKPYAATTEELVAYQEGTAAFAEFPGGARKLAEVALRPGATFYEVEVTEPGQDAGTKYHLFFWDGAGWRMLGPAWRALGG